MRDFQKDIQSFDDLTYRVEGFCNCAVDYCNIPNEEKSNFPFLAEEIIRVYVTRLIDSFDLLRQIAELAHNFFHSIENPQFIIEPNLVAHNVNIHFEDIIRTYKEWNFSFDESILLPYKSLDIFHLALSQTLKGMENLHRQNYNEAIQKIRNKSDVNELVDIENDIEFSFLENRKELNECWRFFLDGIKTQIKYVEKKQNISLFSNPLQQGFNPIYAVNHKEVIEKFIFPDCVNWFLEMENELYRLGFINNNYEWILDKKQNKTQRSLIELIVLLESYCVFQKSRNIKHANRRCFIASLYSIDEVKLKESNKKYKPTLNVAQATFSFLKNPNI